MKSRPSVPGYSIFESIGSGTYSTVYRGQNQATHELVALKIISKECLKGDYDSVFLEREIDISKRLSHPTIVKLHEVINREQSIIMVMDLIEGQTLLDYVNTFAPLNEMLCHKIFTQLVDSLFYLHKSAQIIHRDLKLENIMIDSDMNIHLIDFGFSRNIENRMQVFTTSCGSICYTAPEIVSCQPYTTQVDLWSLGIILYALATGTLPFIGEMKSLIKQILTSEPAIPNEISPFMLDLLMGLLKKDPNERFSIEDVQVHPWVLHARPPNRRKTHSIYFDNMEGLDSPADANFRKSLMHTSLPKLPEYTGKTTAARTILNTQINCRKRINQRYTHQSFEESLICLPIYQDL